MNIAFYAPMKSPDHPRPSGDRRIARLLIKALQASGHQVEIMSDFRSWEGSGDAAAQRLIQHQAESISSHLIDKLRARPAAQKPDIWFSYHVYHKAPDWIGPSVAADLKIPYVVAEASYAAKQAQGPWSAGLDQTSVALHQADAVICLNKQDIPALAELLSASEKLHGLQPFLEKTDVSPKLKTSIKAEIASLYGMNPDLPWLICVAMMRDDAKLTSYQYLAKSLGQVRSPWQLLIIGDGKARHKVEALFGGKLAENIRYAGVLEQKATLRALCAGDLFVWPAVNEAIGMAILEAQASGLPAIVGDSGAVSDLVIDGETGFICAPEDSFCFSTRIEQLLADADLREQYSTAARENFNQHHSLQSAALVLQKILDSLPV